jgi:hypothetical protein
MNPNTIQLTLTDTEWLALRARCAEWGMSREELLIRFIRDFTGAPRNGGSDEREFAERWAERSLTFRGNPPKTEKAIMRAYRLREQAHLTIAAENKKAADEWRSQQGATVCGATHRGGEGSRKAVCVDDGGPVAASTHSL